MPSMFFRSISNVAKLLTSLLIALTASVSQAAGSLAVYPVCPAAADKITAVVVFAVAPTLEVSVSGSTVRWVAQETRSGWTLPPGGYSSVELPPLQPGRYKLELYLRSQPDGSNGGDPATLGPPYLVENFEFEVYSTPPVCAPERAEVIGTSFVSAELGAPYDGSVRIKVTDAHGNAASKYSFSLQRVWTGGNDAFPDIARQGDYAPIGLMTDADGIATLTASANGVPGSFQYYMDIPTYPLRRVYVVFYNRPPGSERPDYPVVEFSRFTDDPNWLHYFMTGDQLEARKLDAGGGWQRTGQVFMAFSPQRAPDGTSPVCRFYGLPGAGLDSHFFSASGSECAAVEQKYVSSWLLETRDAFNVGLPNLIDGGCPARTTALRRFFNNRSDANHRYLLPGAVMDSRWVPEGYGPHAIVMCLPQ